MNLGARLAAAGIDPRHAETRYHRAYAHSVLVRLMKVYGPDKVDPCQGR